MNDRPILQPSDLKRLGTSYMNDFPLRVEFDSSSVRIVPTFPVIGLMIMAIFIAVVFVSLAAILVYNGVVDDTLMWAGIVLAGVGAIVGPVVAHSARWNYLSRRSPLVEYRFADGITRLHAGSKQFEQTQVHSIIAVAVKTPETTFSELQLITIDNGTLTPHLVITGLSSFPRQHFGKVLKSFSDETGIQALVTEGQGFFGGGELSIVPLN